MLHIPKPDHLSSTPLHDPPGNGCSPFIPTDCRHISPATAVYCPNCLPTRLHFYETRSGTDYRPCSGWSNGGHQLDSRCWNPILCGASIDSRVRPQHDSVLLSSPTGAEASEAPSQLTAAYRRQIRLTTGNRGTEVPPRKSGDACGGFKSGGPSARSTTMANQILVAEIRDSKKISKGLWQTVVSVGVGEFWNSHCFHGEH